MLALGVAGKPVSAAAEEPRQSLREALAEAAGHRGYWLLNAGFFVCGFHIAFIATHFPAYLSDKGLGLAIGASALALVGLFNIFGSYLFGLSGDFWRKKYVLSGLYAARGLVIVGFLLLPLSPFTALAFAAALGFLWLGTVPLTSGLVGQMFGVRYLSTLYGIVFLSHQVGSFFGAWAAGYAYDRLGSYDAPGPLRSRSLCSPPSSTCRSATRRWPGCSRHEARPSLACAAGRCCPSPLLGLWLWDAQATPIWLSDFFAACF